MTPSEDFADVAERVAPRLFRIALRMCGRREDAEDLVQDTLLQGFRKWPQFEGRSDPATWLYTIAGRLCHRRRRRRAGEPVRMESLSDLLPSPADPLLALPANADGPLDEHLRREAERAVGRALDRVPAHYRLPLVLADIAELSTHDIAQILGLKEATVKTRIHRARLAVRRALVQVMPTSRAPATHGDHGRQVCMDLLNAKQEALDRGAPFPFSPDALCVRCRSVFATLDLGREVCGTVARGDLPRSLAKLILEQRRATPVRAGTPAQARQGSKHTRPRKIQRSGRRPAR